MKNPYIAKTIPKETIIEHTEKLIEQYNRLKCIYPDIRFLNWDLLYIACVYHDLGKMNTKFQNKLLNKIGIEELLEDMDKDVDEIPHGYLSPAFLPLQELKGKYNEDEIRILFQCIYYHHSREKLENEEPLQKVIELDLPKYYKDFDYKRIITKYPLNPSYVQYTTSGRIPDEYDSEEIFYQYIAIKGLLNKIDYAASGGINVEEINVNLFETTMDFLKTSGFQPNELQQFMIENQNVNVVVIASTGTGKTESGLLWMGNHKGFFTLPLRVSINAIYDRIINKIKFEKQKTGLLHSETPSEYIKRNKDELDIEYLGKTKQMSLPLTVCTLDQLVDFIFKYEGFELKLATLSYSKIVIDEIQMYSPEMVAFLMVAIKYITDLGGKFAIMTATLPPILEDFMERLNIKYVRADEPFLKKVNGKIQLRHKIKVLKEDVNIKHLIENYIGKKVLIIVNTVKKAQELFETLKSKPELECVDISLFHSKFIKTHRVIKEKSIFEMGQPECNKTGIWITTQIVEASLDIDFDVLYTELSDISGLLQRMGRVFRSRDLPIDYINVYVYVGKDKNPSGVGISDNSIIDYDIFELSKEAILKYDGMELDEKEKMLLVEEIYSKKNLEGKRYYDKIRRTINYVKDIKEYEFKKSEINLRNIINKTVMPKSIYLEYQKVIDDNLKIVQESKNYNKRLISRNNIMDLTLSIREDEFEDALKHLKVCKEKVELDKYNVIPIIDRDYTFEEGLVK